MTARLVSILLASALLAAGGQLLFKLGATGGITLGAFLNRWLIIGLVAYGLSTVLWIYALSKAPLTAVYPFTALTFVLAYGGGALVFKETVSTSGVIGVALILGGLFLTTR